MATTAGKDAVIRFIEEAVPGTTPANPDWLLFSRETLNVTLGLDRNQEESLDIGNIDVEQYYLLHNTYSITVECHLYDVARILDLWERNVDNSLKAYSMEYIPDATAAVKHYYRAKGWRVGSIELSVQVNQAWTASITFVGGTITPPVTVDPGIGTGSREDKSAFVDPIKTFASGVVELNGAAWAVLVNGLTLTLENDYEALHTLGQADPVVAVNASATRRITGSADISLDDGASTQWNRVVAGAEHTLEVPFGGAGADLLTLTGVTFPSIEVESNTDDQVLLGGQDFTATGFTIGVVP